MKGPVIKSHSILTPSDGWSSGWFEWIEISEIPNYEGCGVYKIRLANSGGFPPEIPRFIDTDKDGILQICYAGNIKRGIYRFRGSIEGKKYTHAEGQRLQLLKKFTNFKERYKGCKMQYSFKKQASTREARVEQERLLKCYVKKYGEVPPNNNNFPDKHIDWESLQDFHTTQPITFSGFIHDISSNVHHNRLTKTGESI